MNLSHDARYESLRDDEERYADSRSRPRRRQSSASQTPPLSPRHPIAPYVLVAICSAFLTLSAVVLLAPQQSRALVHKYTHKSFVPDFPLSSMVEFQQNSRYTGAGWESAYDALSLNTAPDYTGGFIAVPDPARYGLHGGHELKPLNNSTAQGKYCISVFHQMHCLKMLRMSMQDLIAGTPRQHGGMTSGGGFTEHEDHCFEYVRLGLMCAADTTLEQPRTDGSGGVVDDTDGWGTKHRCKNWDKVVAFANEHSYAKWWDWEKFPVLEGL